MLGYPRKYYIGRYLWELGFIKDKSIAQQTFTELKTNGYIRYEDIPLATKVGRSINVDFLSNAYLVGEKKIIQCTLRDITNRKVVQKALQASEARYRHLFENVTDAILIIDGDTSKIIDANTFVLDMLGYPREYFIDKHLWELDCIGNPSIARRAFTELKTKDSIRYENLPLETKDGQRLNAEFVSHVYLMGDKKIIHSNIRDIPGQKLAQEERARLAAIVEFSDDCDHQ